LLKKEGFEVYTADCVALNYRIAELLNLIKEINPDIIFFETTTPTTNYDIELSKNIKEILPDSKLIVGETHSTIFYNEILKENPQIDFILKGEYEETFIELIKAINEKKDLSNIKGIVYRENGNIKNNPDRALIEPLDKLPYPAYDMFPLYIKDKKIDNPLIYWDGFCQNRPAIQMHSSRGCSYRCDFCVMESGNLWKWEI